MDKKKLGTNPNNKESLIVTQKSQSNQSYVEFIEENFKKEFESMGCQAWSNRHEIGKKFKLCQDEFITNIYFSFALLKKNRYVLVKTNRYYHKYNFSKEFFETYKLEEITIKGINDIALNINGKRYVEITISSEVLNYSEQLSKAIDSSITASLENLILVRESLIHLVTKAIENGTFDLSQKIVNVFENKQFINSNLHVINKKFFNLIEQIHNATLKQSDDYAFNKLGHYGLVEVTRATYNDISIGSYFYKFDSDDNLLLLKVPYVTISIPVWDESIKRYKTDANGNFISEQRFIYERSLEQLPLTLKKEDIKDFQMFGTQLLESTVYLNYEKPKILGTIVSEILFGQSYTILKGINKNKIGSCHSVNDARIVQVMLNNKFDIEFKGVSIYYEFNRMMGKIKNKQHEQNKEQEDGVPSYLNELKALKELYDLGVLTEEEFNQKKVKVLNLK